MPPTAYGKYMQAERRKRDRKTKPHPATGYCGARKRDGSVCRQRAGYGTEHPGIGKCRYHGGNTANHRKNAAKQTAVLMGAPKEINPLDALIWCIKITAGEVEWLSDQIAKLDERDWYEDSILGRQMHILVRERQGAIERLAKFSKDAIALGLAERAVKLAEQYGSTLGRLIRGILDDLNLTPEQQERVPTIVRRHLVMVEGGNPVTAEDRKELPRVIGSRR